MNVTRYQVVYLDRENFIECTLNTFDRKEEAERIAKQLREAKWKARIKEITICVQCNCCDKALSPKEEYIEIDYENIFYCDDCYETNLFTYYLDRNGEELANENDVTIHYAEEEEE